MNVTIRSVCLIASLIITIFIAKAQSLSPNASAAANSGAAITGPYTGKPAISVPVTSLHGRSIRIPVSLDYNASGVRVEDIGSWVGLNWNLAVGGSITRTIRGIDDFGEKGFIASDHPSSIAEACVAGSPYYSYLHEVTLGIQDSEPDLFNLSLPGFSSQFFFDTDGVAHFIPMSPVQLTAPDENREWRVKTTDGYEYLLGGSGFTEALDGATNAWYLKKITTPLGEEVIFSYTAHELAYSLAPSELYQRVLRSDCGQSEDELFFNRDVTMSAKYLQKVQIGGSELEFVLSNRCDVTGKKLDKIIRREAGEVIDEYHFSFSCDAFTQRLWLTELRTVSPESESLPPHRFEYVDRDDLPSIRSLAQDHWGYYNGKTENTRLTPSYVDDDGFVFVGADRTSNANAVKGMLQKIHYPLGGYTEYEFEPNLYNNFTEQYPSLSSETRAIEAEYPFPGTGDNVISLDVTTEVTFTYTIEQVAAASTNSPYIQLSLNTVPVFTRTGTGSGTYGPITLAPGKYDLIAFAEDGTGDRAYVRADYTTLELDPVVGPELTGGGVRVHKITTHDGLGTSEDMVQVFEYEGADLQTSGLLMSGPSYHYKIRSNCAPTVGGDDGTTDYQILASSSAIPLSSAAAGAYVGYSKVTVYHTDGGEEGKTVFDYLNLSDVAFKKTDTPFGEQTAPYVPMDGSWYKNGQLLKREDYRRHENMFVKQAEELYEYLYIDEAITEALIVLDEEVVLGQCNNIFSTYYNLLTSWIQPTKVERTLWDGGGDSLYSSTSYLYDIHEPWLLSQQSQLNSDGTYYRTSYKYPRDLDPSVFDGAIGGMVADHLIGMPVGTIHRKLEGSTEYTTGASVTAFEPVAGTYLPSGVYSLEVASPVTDFTFNASDPLSYPMMKEQMSYAYDEDGNVVETRRYDQKSSVIYGYEDDLPIARATNATFDEIAYTSFETEDRGNWSYSGAVVAGDAYTGSQSFEGALSKEVPADDYHVSLWAKNGTVSVNGESKEAGATWSQLTWKLGNVTQVDVAPSGATIDEVRLHPAEAMMTSYTYRPAIGVTSAAGASGKAGFTTYDSFNRIAESRDFKNQVVGTQAYSLRGSLYGSLSGPTTTSLGTSTSWSVTMGHDLPPGVQCTWNFGDGTPAVTGTSVTHSFARLGYLEVTATLSKPGYTSRVERQTIFVSGALQGTIHTSASILPDRLFSLWVDSPVNPPGTTYRWTFDNGKSGEGQTVSNQYDRLGAYRVSVTMEHRHFATQTIHAEVQVEGSLDVSDWSIDGGSLTFTEDLTYGWSIAINNNPENVVYSVSGLSNQLTTSTSSSVPSGTIRFVAPNEPNTATLTLTATDPLGIYAPVSMTMSGVKVEFSDPIQTVYGSVEGGTVRVLVDNGGPDFNYRLYKKATGTNGLWEIEPFHTHTTSSRDYTYTTGFIESTEVRVQVVDSFGNASPVSDPVTVFILGQEGF